MINFSIESVVNYNLPHSPHYFQRNNQFTIDCPFCNGKKKLNVNINKNLWRCAKCGEAGNPITLHAKLNHIAKKEAIVDLRKCISENKIEATTNIEPIKGPITANCFDRDEVYNALLNQLKLSLQDKENLMARGLSEKEIQKLGYKTYPTTNLNKIAENSLIDKNIPKNECVPGYFGLDKNPNLIKMPKGFLIPVRDNCGRISAFQFRVSNPNNNTPRYLWLSSSSKDDGCGITGCINIHHSGNWKRVTFPKVIALTEGALKADIARTIFDRLDPENEHLFLGLTGLSNVGQLKKLITKYAALGTEEIHLYVDMDYREKKEVAKALEKIINILSSVNVKYAIPDPDNYGYYLDKTKPLIVKTMEWDCKYKGIDDFLFAFEKNRKR